MNPSTGKETFQAPTVPSFVPRSELGKTDELQNRRELNHWLLWAGISPDSKMPVSHIGIYTDFT
jgi:hypothetical protein